jgi:adenylate cyclase
MTAHIPQSIARLLHRVMHVRLQWTIHPLRLGSGLVLFAYLAAHLANHALGLVSVATAETGLRAATMVWHSAAGTLLLYGAAATHLALAIGTLCSRRVLRVPVSEVFRIVLGFGIPLLLIGHFATARGAFELYGVPPDYHRIVWMLFSSGGEGRQLALLAPGWLHGCMGLNFAFGHHPFWRRLRPLLFAAALLLPVLAALGFLAMGRELVLLGADPVWRAAHVTLLDVRQRAGVEHLREWLLAVYLGAIGVALIVHAMRCALESTPTRLPPSRPALAATSASARAKSASNARPLRMSVSIGRRRYCGLPRGKRRIALAAPGSAGRRARQ